jgi:ferredoxin-type protein NapG
MSAQNESNFQRRDFLQLALSAGVMVGIGGLGYFTRREAGFVRPPGAQPRQEFLALCVKCQKCIDVCPTLAIQSVTILEDIANASTPQMNFSRGVCDFCMKCTLVCPTGALRPISKETARMGTAVVLPDICIAYTWVGCTRCYHSCPYQAIELDEFNRPIIDSTKCNGCGECTHVCPSTSLRSSRLLSSKQKGIIVEPLS